MHHSHFLCTRASTQHSICPLFHACPAHVKERGNSVPLVQATTDWLLSQQASKQYWPPSTQFIPLIHNALSLSSTAISGSPLLATTGLVHRTGIFSAHSCMGTRHTVLLSSLHHSTNVAHLHRLAKIKKGTARGL